MISPPLSMATFSRGRAVPVPQRRTKVIGFAGFASWICLHVVLSLAMVRYPLLAQVHALSVFCIGLFFSFQARRSDLVAAVGAYMVTSEGLWRMSGNVVFWEFGKYSLVAIFLVWAVRRRAFHGLGWALTYFLLLLPSALLTFVHRDLGSMRDILSSNLSGPLSLATAVLFFANVALSWAQVSRVLKIALGPLAGLAAVCSFATVRMTAEDFGGGSNFEASGGFGPNQVSSMLGWGMVLAFLWFTTSVRRKWSLPFAGGLILLFGAQAALTFSRTGIYLGVGGITLGMILLARNPRQAFSVLAAMSVLAIIGWFMVYPLLDSFTDGKLSDRFAEKGFTGREDIAWADVKVFLSHPLLGAGIGLSRQARVSEFGVGHMTHTEYTRLLSEHGILGLTALAIMLSLAIQRFLAARNSLERAFVAAMCVSAFLFMASTAMRLALPGFALGFAMVGLAPTRPLRRRMRAAVKPNFGFRTRKMTYEGSA